MIADEEGQILEAHSISAGLDYPGVGPEHAYLRDSGRASYFAVTDAQALAAFADALSAGGHHPGAGVIARDRLAAGERRAARATTCSASRGRGDKDLAEVLGAGGWPGGRRMIEASGRIASCLREAAEGRGPRGA